MQDKNKTDKSDVKQIQVSVHKELYDHIQETKKKYLFSSMADVLKEAYRRTFLKEEEKNDKKS